MRDVTDPFDSGYGGGLPPPRVRIGAIGEAWGLFLARWGSWMLAAALALICNAVVLGIVSSVFDVPIPGRMGGFRMPVPSGGGGVASALSLAVNGFFLGGMIRMACRQVRGLPIGASDLFSVVDVLPNLVLGALIYGLAITIGFMCLVVPGLVVAGVLMFTLPLIVDGGLTATEAISASWDALKGQIVGATLFHLLASLIAGLGLPCCCVGLPLTAPLYSLSIAVLYRDFFLAKGLGHHGKPGKPPSDW